MNEPWFDPNHFGPWFGAAGGIFGGIVGTVVGILVPKGQAFAALEIVACLLLSGCGPDHAWGSRGEGDIESLECDGRVTESK